jgi:hypothetical protein
MDPTMTNSGGLGSWFPQADTSSFANFGNSYGSAMGSPVMAGLMGMGGGLMSAGATGQNPLLGGMNGLMSGLAGSSRARSDERMDTLLEAQTYKLLGLPVPPEIQTRIQKIYGGMSAGQPMRAMGQPMPLVPQQPQRVNAAAMMPMAMPGGGLY